MPEQVVPGMRYNWLPSEARLGRAIERLEDTAARNARDRDHWIRLFNRLEASVTHHRKGKLAGVDTSDEIDEALWKARDKILTDAAGATASSTKQPEGKS
jgi:hypothetical protein